MLAVTPMQARQLPKSFFISIEEFAVMLPKFLLLTPTLAEPERYRKRRWKASLTSAGLSIGGT
jgi:hypothetical protein